MNCKSKSIIITVVVMAVLALTFSVQAGSLTVMKSSSRGEQAAAAAYWTRDRIADAPAMKMPVDMGPGGIDTAALDEVGLIGPAVSEAPGMAEPDADQVAQLIYWRDWEALYDQEALEALEETLEMDVPADEQTGTRNVFTYFDVNGPNAVLSPFWKIYPHKWVGKLTFTTSSGGASCSATAISNNHIVTAAHCVYDTTLNKWYSNWAFTPAYRNGNAPYGIFPWTTARILTAWKNLSGSYNINAWARYDVAIIGVGKNSIGQTLNTAVGWAGRMWNYGYNQLNFNAGYPARIYTDAYIPTGPAQYLRACINESFQQTTETLGGGCYYGRGISGGPWLVNYKPFVVSGYVDSVNSGLYIGQPNLYGARFNSNNIVPLCTDDGC